MGIYGLDGLGSYNKVSCGFFGKMLKKYWSLRISRLNQEASKTGWLGTGSVVLGMKYLLFLVDFGC